MPDTDRSTCSPAAASGPPPCAPPDGPTTGPSGPARVPASRSPLPGVGEVLPTTGICGPKCSGSSASADLQSSLGNRLRAAQAGCGSTLYQTTWKPHVTPSGRQVLRLAGSAHRTSANASTGWPTPTDAERRNYTPSTGQQGLSGIALHAGWGTPRVTTGGGTGSSHPTEDPMGRLEDQAMCVVGWATPAARDWKSDKGQKSDQEQYGTKDKPLPRQAAQASGPTPIGSTAPTAAASGGRLNAEHSLWLMGVPAALRCSIWQAMQSFSRSRRRSAAPRWTKSKLAKIEWDD